MVEPRSLSAGQVSQILPLPGPDDHKYTRGTVALVTGSSTYPGAGVLGVGGASYAGAGLVRFLGSERAANLVLHRFPETLVTVGSADCIVVGSGWDRDLTGVTKSSLDGFGGPAVIDAGALCEPWWADLPGRKVLTPHPGEARRLWDTISHSGEELPTDSVLAASVLAQHTDSTVVLKGATTVVSDGKDAVVYKARTAWPGVAGAGDVLAGVIGSLCAVWARRVTDGKPVATWVDTVSAAVWLHGEAGALAARADADSGGHPIVAGDIISCLPLAWPSTPKLQP